MKKKERDELNQMFDQASNYMKIKAKIKYDKTISLRHLSTGVNGILGHYNGGTAIFISWEELRMNEDVFKKHCKDTKKA